MESRDESDATPGLAVNGKFLGAPHNGVHRTAALYTEKLIGRAADGIGIELLAPAPVNAQSPLSSQARGVRSVFGRGQGWENVALPRAARGRLLVNFCNLAPLLHPRNVVMIHDAQTFLFPSDYSGRQAAAYRMLLPVIGHRAERVLTVSQFARRSLAACGVAKEERIEVIHNGTDHILFTPADDSVLFNRGLAGTDYVLAIGSAKRYKNLALVFDAMRDPRLSKTRLVVAGGPGAAVYRSRGDRPPEDAVFLGSVSDEELRALYENASLFVFPSLTEGFGLPPVEAMHCGCPVIAADAGAMPEVCGDAALLLPPHDPGLWAEAIAAHLHSKDAADLAAAGRRRAQEFTWDAAGDALWSAIEDMVR